MPTATGHDVRLSYLWEDGANGFASSPSDTDNKPFGSDATYTTLEGSNNAVRAFDPNSREAREVIEQMFEGRFTVEFTMTNPWWIRGVIDEASTTGSSAPYTHSFSGTVPESMRIVIGNENTGNERELLGFVVASATVRTDVRGMAKVTLDGAYADESFSSPGAGSLTAQPSVNERPFTFAEASLQRGGSTLSLIQTVSLTISNNTDIIPELGTRVGVDYAPKIRAADISYGDVVEDKDELERMYGSSGATSPQSDVEVDADAVLKYDNGDTGSSKNLIKFTVTDLFPDSYSRSGGGDPSADLEGDLSEVGVTVSAVAENSSSSAR